MLFTATTLPLLVALTQIGLSTGTMLPENAAALVGAGVLSVLFFPLIATVIHRPQPAIPTSPSTRTTGEARRHHQRRAPYAPCQALEGVRPPAVVERPPCLGRKSTVPERQLGDVGRRRLAAAA